MKLHWTLFPICATNVSYMFAQQPQYMRAPYGRGPSYVEGIRYYGQPPNHSQSQTIPVGGIEAQMHLHGGYPAYKLYGSNLGEGRIRQPLPQQQHPNQLPLNPGMVRV